MVLCHCAECNGDKLTPCTGCRRAWMMPMTGARMAAMRKVTAMAKRACPGRLSCRASRCRLNLQPVALQGCVCLRNCADLHAVWTG